MLFVTQVASGASRFMPHGMCYLWEPRLLWLHVASDVLTGAAYWAIPPALVVLVVMARREVPAGASYAARGLPHEWMFLAFGLFIVACGTTHFLGAWTVWNPDYWVSGGVKAVTAVASVATAIALPPLIPRALRLVRAARESEVRRVQLEQANEELERIRDMLQTELESASDDLHAMTREVTRRHREMERALEEARAARDQAAAASQAKTDFMAVISHELRTPLNAIIGYTDLLDTGVGGTLTDRQARHLERIRIGASHLLRIIDDILVFIRADSRPALIARDHVPLRHIIDELVGMFRPEAADKEVELRVDVEDRVVISDRDRLLRVIGNLLSNAVKFTERGHVGISARVEDDRLRVDVVDTGPGIRPEHRERIYEAFWQVDQSSTRRVGGTGLGLSIARRLGNQMGGDVELVDRDGPGSHFKFVVPVEVP